MQEGKKTRKKNVPPSMPTLQHYTESHPSSLSSKSPSSLLPSQYAASSAAMADAGRWCESRRVSLSGDPEAVPDAGVATPAVSAADPDAWPSTRGPSGAGRVLLVEAVEAVEARWWCHASVRRARAAPRRAASADPNSTHASAAAEA